MSILVKGVTTFLELSDTPASYAGEAYQRTRVNAAQDALETVVEEAALEFVIDGSGAEITAGEKGHLEVPFDCDIQVVEMLADQVGAIKVDIWADTYANFPPDNLDSICGGNEPEITAGNDKCQDSTLTGWTTALTKGHILAFNVDSIATIQRVVVSLKVNKL